MGCDGYYIGVCQKGHIEYFALQDSIENCSRCGFSFSETFFVDLTNGADDAYITDVEKKAEAVAESIKARAAAKIQDTKERIHIEIAEIAVSKEPNRTQRIYEKIYELHNMLQEKGYQ